ncbi:unnamed protein product [Haemonchus placei]|uniref:Nudix hydrolase domain-containing protein n=1 Tax=Haemonchus placei TaxID=6290 RepID=A0A0N4WDK7_HAEPC|nr:unnamed protein product [Haemonchus placei]
MDEEGRVLMVREQRRELKWKFPGGSAEPNEDLLKTAERKVKQKTGVVAEGEAIISLGDEVNSKPRHEFFDHHRNIWLAYLESLEDVVGEESYEATKRDVTPKMFNFSCEPVPAAFPRTE